MLGLKEAQSLVGSETRLLELSSLRWGCSFHAFSSLLPVISCWRSWSEIRYIDLFRTFAFKSGFNSSQLLSDFFDGLCGAVVGVIAIIAVQILKSSIEGSPRQKEEGDIKATLEKISQSAPAAVLFLLALAALYKFNSKYIALLLLAAGAIAGQFLFI